jgi:hypothetical protein
MVSFLLAKEHRLYRIICRDQVRLPSHVPELRVYTNKVRHLGIIVDNRLSFQDQANEDRRWVNFALSRLWHYADVTPVLSRKRLVQSLI